MIYLILFLEFFKIGLFCFGGAFGMIPLIEETVLKYDWLTESEFYDFIGVCESTPGPIAVNMATYVGSLQGGILGSIVATLGVVLPSFVIILLIASLFKNLTENRIFKGFMTGVQPVIIGLILSTGIILLAKTLGYSETFKFNIDYSVLIILTLLVGIYFFSSKIIRKKISAVCLILISAGLGIAVCSFEEFAIM